MEIYMWIVIYLLAGVIGAGEAFARRITDKGPDHPLLIASILFLAVVFWPIALPLSFYLNYRDYKDE